MKFNRRVTETITIGDEGPEQILIGVESEGVSKDPYSSVEFQPPTRITVDYETQRIDCSYDTLRRVLAAIDANYNVWRYRHCCADHGLYENGVGTYKATCPKCHEKERKEQEAERLLQEAQQRENPTPDTAPINTDKDDVPL